jgi:hypothetical protein
MRDDLINVLQAGRLGDILLFGPLLIWLGLSLNVRPWVKWALVAGGAATSISNLRNLLMVEQVRTGAVPAETLLGMGRL